MVVLQGNHSLPHKYRRQRTDGTRWNHLPQDPFDLICAKLALELKLTRSIIASLCLVCKAWREAVKRSPWKVQCQFKGGRTLQDICKALPSMATLSVQCSRRGSINLHPLLSLTELRNLDLQGEELVSGHIVEPYVELGYLPSSLQTLDIDTTYVDPTTFSSITCTGLTRLRISFLQNKDADVAELLSHLPALKV